MQAVMADVERGSQTWPGFRFGEELRDVLQLVEHRLSLGFCGMSGQRGLDLDAIQKGLNFGGGLARLSKLLDGITQRFASVALSLSIDADDFLLLRGVRKLKEDRESAGEVAQISRFGKFREAREELARGDFLANQATGDVDQLGIFLLGKDLPEDSIECPQVGGKRVAPGLLVEDTLSAGLVEIDWRVCRSRRRFEEGSRLLEDAHKALADIQQALLGSPATLTAEDSEEASSRLLASLKAPVLAIPGNHDEREAFRRAFAGQSWLPEAGPVDYVADHGAVRIVALDVTLPGLHHGAVSEAGAAWLDGVLDSP